MSDEDQDTVDDVEIVPQRTSILNQADIRNQRMIEREAMRISVQDQRANISPQIWYDSLRDGDDGRYCSNTELLIKTISPKSLSRPKTGLQTTF